MVGGLVGTEGTYSESDDSTKCDAAVTGRDYLFRGCDAGALTICYEVSLYRCILACLPDCASALCGLADRLTD